MKNAIKAVLGCSLFFVMGLFVSRACKADIPKLPPGLQEQAMYEAHRLFRVGDCEVWGLTYKKDNHVVSVCPGQQATTETRQDGVGSR